jgi:hypothetical protein
MRHWALKGHKGSMQVSRELDASNPRQRDLHPVSKSVNAIGYDSALS